MRVDRAAREIQRRPADGVGDVCKTEIQSPQHRLTHLNGYLEVTVSLQRDERDSGLRQKISFNLFSGLSQCHRFDIPDNDQSNDTAGWLRCRDNRLLRVFRGEIAESVDRGFDVVLNQLHICEVTGLDNDGGTIFSGGGADALNTINTENRFVDTPGDSLFDFSRGRPGIRNGYDNGSGRYRWKHLTLQVARRQPSANE